MINCFFVSDLHGKIDRYDKLFQMINKHLPEIVFFGGDLLPNYAAKLPESINDFVNDYLVPEFRELKERLKEKYPKVFLILGNDDPKTKEQEFIEIERKTGYWYYMHNRKVSCYDYNIYGYANIPPTPFLYKDWERYDVSRYIDPGCIHPTEGYRIVSPDEDIEYVTIEKDLRSLASDNNEGNEIFLFHSPPYKTNLDRAALDGKKIDHVPLDVYVGSIAIKRFIEERQPLVTLHGHVHESASITGEWKEVIGKTYAFNAAHDKEELSIINFYLEQPDKACRLLI